MDNPSETEKVTLVRLLFSEGLSFGNERSPVITRFASEILSCHKIYSGLLSSSGVL